MLEKIADQHGRMVAVCLMKEDIEVARVMARAAIDRALAIEEPEPIQKADSVAQLELEDDLIWKLEENGILTIRNLCRHSRFDLTSIKGFGVGTIEEIETALAEHGFSLRD